VTSLAEGEDWLPVPSDLPGASVVYEDPHVAVLCKPHDVHTEPSGRWKRDACRLPAETSPRGGENRLGRGPDAAHAPRFFHQRGGSCPLTAQAWTFLRHEREMGRIGKRYLCVVEGEVPEAGPDRLLDRFRRGRDRTGTDGDGGPGPVPVDLDRAGEERGRRPYPGPGDDLPRQAAPDPGAPRRGRPSDRGRPPVWPPYFGGTGKTRLMLHAEEVRFRHPRRGSLCGSSAPPARSLP